MTNEFDQRRDKLPLLAAMAAIALLVVGVSVWVLTNRDSTEQVAVAQSDDELVSDPHDSTTSTADFPTTTDTAQPQPTHDTATTIRPKDGPCDSAPPHTPERTCEGADDFYDQMDAEFDARERERLSAPCPIDDHATTVPPDFEATDTESTPLPTTTTPRSTTTRPITQTFVTAGPPCLPCSAVTGPNDEIYQRCLNEDDSTIFPEPDPVTGDIPCDTTPPMTLGPGCIGYEP